MDKIPDIEFIERNKELQKKMDENDIDILFIYGDDFHPANIRYLVDFWPSFENVLLVLPKEGEITIAGSPEIELYKKDAARIGNIVNVAEFIIEGEEAPDVETMSLKEIVFNYLKGEKAYSFGLIGSDYIPLGIYKLILSSIGEDTVKNYSDLLEGVSGLRAVKSKAEITMIKKAYQLAESGMDKALDIITDGITEYEIAAEIEYIMRKNGAEGFAFDTMVASGRRSNTVVGRATDKIISKGDLVMVSAGARYQGYASSIGRPVYIGIPGKELKRFLSLGVKAADISQEFLITGGIASKVDTEAREFIKNQGFGRYHLYSVGHGLGLHEVEEPFCTPSTNYELVKGNVISIDVGIFGHPEFGGYRYEDGFYLDSEKGVALSNFKKITF
jgi:Xaa-Pro aminopeptidase